MIDVSYEVEMLRSTKNAMFELLCIVLVSLPRKIVGFDTKRLC
jgi:hypothetical protein